MRFEAWKGIYAPLESVLGTLWGVPRANGFFAKVEWRSVERVWIERGALKLIGEDSAAVFADPDAMGSAGGSEDRLSGGGG